MAIGAVSRYKYERSQKFVTLQNLYCEQWCGVRVVRYTGHGIESRKFKNRDKQMSFIVRVSTSKLLYMSQLIIYGPY